MSTNKHRDIVKEDIRKGEVIEVSDFTSSTHSNSKDDPNLEFLKNFELEKNPQEVPEKNLIRKLDKTFMLPMLVVYTLQFLDKVIMNYAKVMGMTADIGLVGNQFSDLATYFFVAYIVAEFVQGFIIIPKFPIAKVLGANVIVWGILTCCCAAAQNFKGMLALRILLGILESSVVPCLTIITTNFYSRREGSFRIGIWYSGLGLGQILGGIISYLFQLVKPSASIEGWRIAFIVVGFFNILTGVYVWFLIPSSPLSAKMLSAREKYDLLMKLSKEKIGIKNNKVSIPQILELLRDIQAWLLLVISATISFSSNTISTFSATDIISFGFNSKEAALLNMPSGVVSITTSFISTYFIMKGFPRYLAISLLLLPAVCGGALMSFLPKSNQAGLLIGIYMINTVTAPLAICYSWAGVNFAGSTKKAGSTAIFISIGFAVGNIVGPQSYRVKDAPDFYPAKVSMLATQAVSIALAFLIAAIYYLRNKLRDKEQRGVIIDEDELHENTWKDLTDFQNRSFRYSY